MSIQHVEVDEAAVQALKSGLRGQLLRPGDDGYDTARKVWNGMIDRHPALIARCATASDVMRSVRFGRERGLEVAVRGGGHSASGLAVCEGGLVIDLSGMKSMRIDSRRRTVRCEPGLTWGEFDRETQAFGLALTGGLQSTTGIAGFTLGGGFGYLARQHGLTSDSLLSADVVTAGGEMLTASADENADLFWGLHGGGGNFGIVTSFEFQLHPLGPVLGGMLMYPVARAKEVIGYFREFAATAPNELFPIVAFTTAPAAPSVPAHLQGKPVVSIVLCYSADPEEGKRILRPLYAALPPDADLVRVRPYTDMQMLLDAANPAGRLNYWKSEYLQGLPDGAVNALIEHNQRRSSPFSKIMIPRLGGAISTAGDSAYVHRSAPYLINVMAMWADPQDSDGQVAWARELWSALRPFSAGGVYVNFLSDEGADRVKAAYDPQTYRKLATLKKKYDPENFFHLNQNIQPSKEGSSTR